MHRRARVYAVVSALLLGLLFVLRRSAWVSGVEFHDFLETAATMLALGVGVSALLRFYSKKTNLYLFVGAAFLGGAFLDGYHTLATSALLSDRFPSNLDDLSAWSWIASRTFLALFLWLSVLAWKREGGASAARISEKAIYLAAASLTTASFFFFALVPLPRAYLDSAFFHRPEEFVPAFFFLFALLGYLRKGAWKDDFFEHCLVLSLIVGLVGEALFMPLSAQLFDAMFNVAHLLKLASYALVGVGLAVGMLELFRQAEDSEERIHAIVDHVDIGIITIDTHGIVEQFNPAAEYIFKYAASEVIGRNVKMLMPEPYHSEHDTYIDRHMKTGEAHIIGVGRAVEGRRRDGTTFPMELAVSRVSLRDRLMFTGIVRDLSDRRVASR